jgi:hypothetical protein
MKQLENPYTYFAEYTQTIMLLAFILFLVNSALEPFNNSGRSVAQTLDGYVTKATPTLFELVKGKAELRITGYPQALQTRCSSTYTGDKNGSEHIGSKATVDVPNGKNASEETETSHSSDKTPADSAPAELLNSGPATLQGLIGAMIACLKRSGTQAEFDALSTLGKENWENAISDGYEIVAAKNRHKVVLAQKYSVARLAAEHGGNTLTPEGKKKVAKRGASQKENLADHDYRAAQVKKALIS